MQKRNCIRQPECERGGFGRATIGHMATAICPLPKVAQTAGVVGTSTSKCQAFTEGGRVLNGFIWAPHRPRKAPSRTWAITELQPEFCTTASTPPTRIDRGGPVSQWPPEAVATSPSIIGKNCSRSMPLVTINVPETFGPETCPERTRTLGAGSHVPATQECQWPVAESHARLSTACNTAIQRARAFAAHDEAT
jgi:hypothetical protein